MSQVISPLSRAASRLIPGRRFAFMVAALLIGSAAPGARADEATFQAFGGKPGLQAIMEDFMGNLLADPRTHPFFAKVDQTHLKAQLVDQIGQILGGPCQYTGAKMGPVHKGLGIETQHFNALVEDLQDAMDKHHVPFADQNRLLAALAPLHRDIVEEPAPPDHAKP